MCSNTEMYKLSECFENPCGLRQICMSYIVQSWLHTIKYLSVSPAVPDRVGWWLFSERAKFKSVPRLKRHHSTSKCRKERRDENWEGGGKLSISKAAKGSAFGLRSGMRSEVRFATKPKFCSTVHNQWILRFIEWGVEMKVGPLIGLSGAFPAFV